MNGDSSDNNGARKLPPMSDTVDPITHLLRARALDPPRDPGQLACLDRFEVLRLIGSGGMAFVLLARDPTSQDLVAVKLLKPELRTNRRSVQWFLVEARHMSRMAHPNGMPVLEVSDRSEAPYFVLPYAQRGSLAGLLRDGRPLERSTILRVARDVAEGLAYAHGKGLIHRDIKPSNILLVQDGRARVTDFGLSRTLYTDPDLDVRLSHCIGTAPYMSPAVAAGHAEDTRCDIYSYGAVLYEMLTGRRPYEGESGGEVVDAIIAGPPRPIRRLNPQAPPPLVAVAEGAMARKLRNRYAEMGDVLADIRRIEAGKRPLGPHDASGNQPKPRHWLLALGIFLPVLLLAGALAAVLGATDQRRPPNGQESGPLEMPVAEPGRPRTGAPSPQPPAFTPNDLHAALKAQNPDYNGHATCIIRHGRPIEARVDSCNLQDLSPLKGLGLKRLSCQRNRISDLSPLRGMELEELFCQYNRISDLSPLRGMPLIGLRFRNNRVADLSPLRGLPLRHLHFSNNRAGDLRPLRGMRIEHLTISANGVTDISPLAGMPLEVLAAGNNRISDLSPLRSMELEHLNVQTNRIEDISVLQGMPLVGCSCDDNAIESLEPLRGAPLVLLECGRNPISDLAPLQGMELRVLECGETEVSDLSPLRDMPLEELGIAGTDVTDLSVLKTLPIEHLAFSPFDIKTDFSFLRDHPTLRFIDVDQFLSDGTRQPAEQFWEWWDEYGRPPPGPGK